MQPNMFGWNPNPLTRNPGFNPEEEVKKLLKEGKMTQAQFEQFKIIADQMTGRKS